MDNADGILQLRTESIDEVIQVFGMGEFEFKHFVESCAVDDIVVDLAAYLG